MYILGIETSCDETSAAIIRTSIQDPYVTLVSNVVSTSLNLHAKTGGIIPEIAAREQIRYIIPVMQKALSDAKLSLKEINTIAVTYGPGLIGSLLVGVETAKTIAAVYDKPVIPVNHLFGHIYANFIRENSKQATKEIRFPGIGLIVSGGHTDLVYMKNQKSIKWLGGTLDDAAGEALDKIGRLLGLPYPAGPTIEKLSKIGNQKAYHFPRPIINSEDLDFSFSGLKTAVFRQIQSEKNLNKKKIADIAASVQKAVIDVLVAKTLKAAKQYKAKSILLGGGVAANQTLRDQLTLSVKNNNLSSRIFAPQPFLCTDNAAMIAACAHIHNNPSSWHKITADPQLYFN